MSEPDFRKMGDPMNDRLPPNDNLLNRRRRKEHGPTSAQGLALDEARHHIGRAKAHLDRAAR